MVGGVCLILAGLVIPLHSQQLALSRCPGRYCGRICYANNSIGPCGRCPRGYTSDGYLCQECKGQPTYYQWFYLGFICLSITYLDMVSFGTLMAYPACALPCCLAVLRLVLSSLCSLLVFNPVGSLSLRSCPTELIEDWYTLFSSPHSSLDTSVRCTQEAVYPFYSIVLVNLVFYLIISMVMDFILIRTWRTQSSSLTAALYIRLYSIPALCLLHLMLAGLVYVSFPVLLLMMSSMDSAFFYSRCITSFASLRCTRTLLVTMMYSFCNLCGISAVVDVVALPSRMPLLAFAFLPVTFHMLIVRASDPEQVLRNHMALP